MSKWQRKLDISDVWDKSNNGEIPVYELCHAIAERLKALKALDDENLEEEKVEIIEAFNSLFEEECDDFDEFNDVMRELYDWADTKLDFDFGGKAVCWIEK